ncbi:hypothetical protein IW150_006890, partial [Coemansia sp. RSA 2607]
MIKNVSQILKTTTSRAAAVRNLSSIATRGMAACALASSVRLSAVSAVSIRALSTSTPLRGNGSVDSDLS